MDTSYRGILKFAFPIMVGVFVQSVILFVDSAFLSRVDPVAFDAAGNAGLLYITFFMMANGLAEAGQIIIARREGEGKKSEVCRVWRHLMLTLIITSVLMFVLIYLLSHHLLMGVVQSPAIGENIVAYLDIRAFGILFAVILAGFNAFYIGIGKSRVLLYNTLIISVVNIGLDYALIFGNWGFSEMGIEGAAWATLLAEFSACIFIVLYTIARKTNKEYELFSRLHWEVKRVKKLLKIGLPLMAQGFLGVGSWAIFFMLIEQMGAHDLEASQVVHKLYFLALIPIIGFSSTTKTYVSHLLGEGRAEDVIPIAKKILLISLTMVVLLCHGMILYPTFWINIVDNNPLILDTAKSILMLLTGSILLHTISSVLLNILSGSGMTRKVMFIEFITMFSYLTLSYLMIMEWEKSIVWVWSMEYVYFVSIFVLSLWYVRKENWKKVKV